MTTHYGATGCAAVVLLMFLSGCPQPPSSGADLTLKEGYTILLMTASGPQHVQRIKKLKEFVEKREGWKHLFIVHKAGRSELLWGKYPTPKSAEPNLKRAHTSPDGRRRPLFPRAVLAALPGEDVGPAEWNLLNAPGTYSVQVATYYDIPDQKYFGRKRSAVEMCRQLRKRGYEAYYYHATVRSHVMIGTFDESAIRVVEDPGPVKKVRNEYVDPGLRGLLEEFKYFLENGIERKIRRAVRRDGSDYVETIYVKPFPVRIPRKKGEDVEGEITRLGDRQPRKTPRDSRGSWRPAPPDRRLRGF